MTRDTYGNQATTTAATGQSRRRPTEVAATTHGDYNCSDHDYNNSDHHTSKDKGKNKARPQVKG